MSTGKFTYDILWPEDKGYPLIDILTIKSKPRAVYEPNATQQEVEDEIAAFEAELTAELDQ